MSHVKKLCICALCIALCSVLPPAFHALGLGVAFSPLHLPVLLCGTVCGWLWGLVCGVVGPLVSSLVTGTPPAVKLVTMLPELAAYGLLSGLFMKLIRTGRHAADLYLSLLPAMLLGRMVGGAAQALFYLKNAQEYSVALWAGSYLLATAPGAVTHLVLVPLAALALERAQLIPRRYPVPSEHQTSVFRDSG